MSLFQLRFCYAIIRMLGVTLSLCLFVQPVALADFTTNHSLNPRSDITGICSIALIDDAATATTTHVSTRLAPSPPTRFLADSTNIAFYVCPAPFYLTELTSTALYYTFDSGATSILAEIEALSAWKSLSLSVPLRWQTSAMLFLGVNPGVNIQGADGFRVQAHPTLDIHSSVQLDSTWRIACSIERALSEHPLLRIGLGSSARTFAWSFGLNISDIYPTSYSIHCMWSLDPALSSRSFIHTAPLCIGFETRYALAFGSILTRIEFVRLLGFAVRTGLETRI